MAPIVMLLSKKPGDKQSPAGIIKLVAEKMNNHEDAVNRGVRVREKER